MSKMEILQNEKNSLREQWFQLSEKEQSERWDVCLSQFLCDKVWFEEDVFKCPFFFLSEEERDTSLKKKSEIVFQIVHNELRNMNEWLYRNSTCLYDFMMEALRQNTPMLVFVHVLVSKGYLTSVDFFTEWWNDSNPVELFGRSRRRRLGVDTNNSEDNFAVYMLLVVGRSNMDDDRLNLDALRQIVRDSNWRTGYGCGTPEDTKRAFSSRTINKMLSRLAEYGNEVQGYDMDGLKTFLLEDAGCDINVESDDEDSVMGGNDKLNVFALIALHHDENAEFCTWLYSTLGRRVETDIKYNASRGLDYDFLCRLNKDAYDLGIIAPVDEESKRPRLL